MRLSSTTFKNHLRRRFREAEGLAPSSEALREAIHQLEADAQFDGEEQEVHLRVAGHDGRIYIDLADERSNVVEVDVRGWRIIHVREAPVKFRRAKGMAALPEPKRGGSLKLLRKCIRVATDADFSRLVAWFVQALNPEGSYPVLIFGGEQDTGKSVATEIARETIDPNRVPIRSCSPRLRDLAVSADNSWCLAFDNLSGITTAFSNAFCRLSTGGGFAVRKHYKNRTEELFWAKRPLILNGIETLATRPDLQSRAVVLRLRPIPEGERVPEGELKADLEHDRPAILGALLDAVSAAQRGRSAAGAPAYDRMAEYIQGGRAVEELIGVEKGTFEKAHRHSRKEADEEAVENDTVAAAIQEMLADDGHPSPGEWKGKVSTLLEDLKAYLPNAERPPKDFPTTYQAMTGRLRRLMPVLRAVGIEHEKDLGSQGRAHRLFLTESSKRQSRPAESAEQRSPQPANGSADYSAAPEVVKSDGAENPATRAQNGTNSADSAGRDRSYEGAEHAPDSEVGAPRTASGAQLDPDSLAEGQVVFDLSRKKHCRIRHVSGQAVVVEAVGSGGKLLGDTWTTISEKLSLPTESID